MEFPTPIKGISEFEKRNDVRVHVLGVKRRDIYILRKCNYESEKKVIVLLLTTNGEKKHYTAVSSLSRLLASSNTKHKCKQHFCLNCLQGFNLEEIRGKRSGRSVVEAPFSILLCWGRVTSALIGESS